MDKEADAIRHTIDETLSGLTGKLSELEHQVVGTVGSVKSSMSTVRDSFDIKLHVRQRPWTVVAGASLLGFLGGFRSRRRSSQTAHSRPLADPPRFKTAAVAEPPASIRAPWVGADPSWINRLGETFQPEFTQLRGVAVAVLIQIAREVIANRTSDSVGRPGKDSVGASTGRTDAAGAQHGSKAEDAVNGD